MTAVALILLIELMSAIVREIFVLVTLLTPNDLYMSRTAPLTSKRYILYI